MGEVYSHLSEEERQVIQIEVGNGASIRGIGAMLGRSPSSISREIKRNTWFPSNENESYRPYRPKRLKAGPWTGRYYIAGPAQRKADRRSIQATKALPAVARPPVGAGGRMAGPRLVAAAHQRQAARPVAGRCAHARVPGDHLPMGLLQQAASGTLGAVPAARARRRRRHGGRRTSRFPIPGRVPISERPPEADGRSAFGHWGGRQRHRSGMQPAHRGGEEDQVPHGPRRSGQDRRRERRGAAGHVLAAAGRRARQRHARQRHRVRPPRKAARRAGHGHVLRRPVLQLAAGEATRTATARSAGICPNAARSGWTWQRRSGRSSTRSTTAPCACSATARPPRHSPTNC